MNKILTSVVVLIIVAVGVLYSVFSPAPSFPGSGGHGGPPGGSPDGKGSMGPGIHGPSGNSTSNLTGNVDTFIVNSSHTRFYINGTENPDMVVKLGDKVKVEFSSQQGHHDWVLDEFNASTAIVGPGEVSTVEFVADKRGTFEYYCSVGNHRALGMKGKFIVE